MRQISEKSLNASESSGDADAYDIILHISQIQSYMQNGRYTYILLKIIMNWKFQSTVYL